MGGQAVSNFHRFTFYWNWKLGPLSFMIWTNGIRRRQSWWLPRWGGLGPTGRDGWYLSLMDTSITWGRR